jgi:hypothetical protein
MKYSLETLVELFPDYCDSCITDGVTNLQDIIDNFCAYYACCLEEYFTLQELFYDAFGVEF